MKRIISIFLAVLMLFTLVGCNSNNTGDTSDETNNVEVITPSTSNKDDESEVDDDNVFDMLSFDAREVNEGYNLEATSGDKKWNGSFNRNEIDGKFVTFVGSGADFGYRYDYNYDLMYGIPKDAVLTVKPQEKLPDVEDPMYDYDTSLYNVREFSVNYYDFILEACSNSFDSIDFIYKNDIKINGNIGCFKFFQYSFDDFSEHVLYDGNYYQLLVYATTMEKANIHFYFDEETQTFTIEADKEISNIFIEVTTKDNSSVETVCPEDIKGNKLTITINEDCTANVEIK